MNPAALKKKITLGTVQLGLPYGINNKAGQPSQAEAFKILERASSEHITLLDSAEAYGDSLSVICAYAKSHPHSPFRVISKFIGGHESLEKNVRKTLNELQATALYGYMFHRFADYQSGRFKREVLDLKEKGLIERTGVSIYALSELKTVVQDTEMDIIQIPFNPYDASKEKIELLEAAKAGKKEIHVRSVFLQGLFFKQPHELTGNLAAFAPILERFQSMIKEVGLDVRQACFNFALHSPVVDKVVIGVETCEQLEENTASILPAFPTSLSERFQSIPTVNEILINPSLWKL